MPDNQNNQELHEIAKKSRVNLNAPVTVTSEIKIKASPDKTWRLITIIDNWKKYHPDITRSYLEDTFFVDKFFIWKIRSLSIMKSQIAVIKSLNEFCFSSVPLFMGFIKTGNVIMFWDLEYISEQESKLTVKMSVEGFFAKILNHDKARHLIDKWLKVIKSTAENA